MPLLSRAENRFLRQRLNAVRHVTLDPGGPGVVRAVLSSGKKAIGAGAGNPPVIVDDTADIRKAGKDIIDGCTFDNNLPCIAERRFSRSTTSRMT